MRETQVQIQQFRVPPVYKRRGSLNHTWFQRPLGTGIVLMSVAEPRSLMRVIDELTRKVLENFNPVETIFIFKIQ